jgi:hypothetical protein
MKNKISYNGFREERESLNTIHLFRGNTGYTGIFPMEDSNER